MLRVDAEPKRSAVKKQLSVEKNVLIGYVVSSNFFRFGAIFKYYFRQFTGDSARQLRVGVNCFFDNVALILETFEFTGPPVSDKYSHN